MAAGQRVTGLTPSANSATLPWTRLVGSCAWLAAVVIPGALVAAVICGGTFAWQTISTAAIAGGVCYVAAALSLVATFVGNRAGYPVQGLLIGMFFRMGLPLLAIAAVGTRGTLGATIVLVYLLALIADTILALRMGPAANGTRQAGGLSLAGSQPRPSVAN